MPEPERLAEDDIVRQCRAQRQEFRGVELGAVPGNGHGRPGHGVGVDVARGAQARQAHGDRTPQGMGGDHDPGSVNEINARASVQQSLEPPRGAPDGREDVELSAVLQALVVHTPDGGVDMPVGVSLFRRR